MIINKKYFLFVLFISQIIIYSQTDWVRWEKSYPTYQLKNDYLEREYDFSIESVSDLVVKPIINVYWFMVSDVDGANCPFQPSCSRFLVESVKETNPFQGVVMFFDRFARDTNIFGRHEHYPRYAKNHFYDPVNLYTLDKEKIIYIPAKTFVNN